MAGWPKFTGDLCRNSRIRLDFEDVEPLFAKGDGRLPSNSRFEPNYSGGAISSVGRLDQ